MQAVPPRRGQKVKSLILPPFNNGLPFTLVRVQSSDGVDRIGVLERRGLHESQIWLEYDIKSTTVSNNKMTTIAIPTAPVQAYGEFNAVIGGVGKHVRWNVLMPNNKRSGRCDLLVKDITDKPRFEDFIANVIRPFGLCEFKYDENETIVQVPDLPTWGK